MRLLSAARCLYLPLAFRDHLLVLRLTVRTPPLFPVSLHVSCPQPQGPRAAQALPCTALLRSVCLPHRRHHQSRAVALASQTREGKRVAVVDACASTSLPFSLSLSSGRAAFAASAGSRLRLNAWPSLCSGQTLCEPALPRGEQERKRRQASTRAAAQHHCWLSQTSRTPPHTAFRLTLSLSISFSSAADGARGGVRGLMRRWRTVGELHLTTA